MQRGTKGKGLSQRKDRENEKWSAILEAFERRIRGERKERIKQNTEV